MSCRDTEGTEVKSFYEFGVLATLGHFTFSSKLFSLIPVFSDFILLFKGTTRNFHFVLILAASVNKSGNVSWNEYQSEPQNVTSKIKFSKEGFETEFRPNVGM